MKYVIILLFITGSANVFAQSLAINTDGSTADASSILDVKSSDKGILIPRMSKAEKDAIAVPAGGLLIYQNAPDSIGFYFYNGSSWVWLQNSNEGWGLNGNNNVAASNFLGSINNSALRFKVNDTRSGLIDSSYQNTSFGYQSLLATTTSGNNTAMGFDAGKSLTIGYSNTLIGNKALAASFNGSENVAVGDSAMGNAINSSSNTAVGFRTLKLIKDGGQNSTIGVGAMEYKDTAQSCVAIGRFALSGFGGSNNSPDTGTIAIGTEAGRFNNTSYNTFIGYQSGMGVEANPAGITGGENVSVGAYSLNKIQSGRSNSTVGYGALNSNIGGSYNVAMGYSALRANINAQANTAVGAGALEKNTNGYSNTAIGRLALFNNVHGYSNTAIGQRALQNNLNGNYAVAVGLDALVNDTAASETVAIGGNALYHNQARYGNTAIGTNSLFYNTYTTGVPILATEGLHNTALGHSALFNNQRGSGSVAIGYRAGFNSNSSNKLYIENSDADKDNALIYGDFEADSLNLNANVNIRDFTSLGTQASGSPAIKMKKMTIAAGPAVDGVDNYPFGGGITDNQILAIDVLMTYDFTSKIPPGYIDVAGYEYNIQVQFNGVTIINKIGNSANIGSKPITVLITYQQ